MSDVADLILEIRETYRQRQDLLRAEIRLDLQVQAIRRRIEASLNAAASVTGEERPIAGAIPSGTALVPSHAAGSEHGQRRRDAHCAIADALPPSLCGENGHRRADARICVAVVSTQADVATQPSADVMASLVTTGGGQRRSDVRFDHATPSGEAQFLADFAAMRLIEMRDLGRQHRRELDRRLTKLAMQLPVWSWAAQVRGIGGLGLAQIVGEAGDLSNYQRPAQLWKRMGLAVIDGQRQRRVSGADAIVQGYSPTRRAVMWVIGDCLVKTNRDGAYRTFYLAEKQRQTVKLTAEPVLVVNKSGELVDGTKLIAHRRAQRHMEKRFLRDLWRAWTAMDRVPSELGLPDTLSRDLAEMAAS